MTYDKVAEFHRALGLAPGHGSIDDPTLRVKLHVEENIELVDALFEGDRAHIAQELADVVYVAYGTAYSLGIPLDEVIAEVHRANMTKFGPGGEFELNEAGKLLKGPHYRAPDVASVLGGRSGGGPR